MVRIEGIPIVATRLAGAIRGSAGEERQATTRHNERTRSAAFAPVRAYRRSRLLESA